MAGFAVTSWKVIRRRPGVRLCARAPPVWLPRDRGCRSFGPPSTVKRPRLSTWPSSRRSLMARRTVTRATPNRSESSRPVGRTSPSPSASGTSRSARMRGARAAPSRRVSVVPCHETSVNWSYGARILVPWGAWMAGLKGSLRHPSRRGRLLLSASTPRCFRAGRAHKGRWGATSAPPRGYGSIHSDAGPTAAASTALLGSNTGPAAVLTVT